LGGAQLAGALLQEDLVNELQLTICPLLLGGRAQLAAGCSAAPG
jgi:5-amino-6-(5-phosphoribosylamino)uracil reductase